ncbi:hypothetical protein [Nocardia carnea]|uniref:hypothetical protein n=1 Tax=Nocardia carnea TaxID=37328 RepID=UPI002454A5AC|nr:hypothetical protein [Nocardia carnea]
MTGNGLAPPSGQVDARAGRLSGKTVVLAPRQRRADGSTLPSGTGTGVDLRSGIRVPASRSRMHHRAEERGEKNLSDRRMSMKLR